MAEAGVCSRREADRLIEQGRITVDGEVLSVGCKVMPGQRVCVDGKTIKKEEEMILLAFNKPVGIVCKKTILLIIFIIRNVFIR